MNFSVKAKLLKIKYRGGQSAWLLVSVLFIFTSFSVSAQVENPVVTPKGNLPVRPDSARFTGMDTIPLTHADSVKLQADSLKNVKKGDITTTIFYSAQDSINSSIDRKIVKLYGDAKIRYGDIELEADEIVIDYEKSTITANARTDSLGNRIGYPTFKNGAELYETRDMVYNFKTKNAKISEVATKQGEGILHGKAVFKNEKNELFSIGNGYTTCDLAHPHFRIVSTKIKAIPGDKMISGPFYMEFMDVPTPLGFIFGIFPSQRKSASGILVPSYGEEQRRGFFLRNGGYFFDINEYIKVSLTADLYSKGSSAIYVTSNYNKKYAYTGSFNFGYTNNVTVDKIEAPSKSKDFRLTWSHNPQSKGTGRFAASVTAATASYTSNNWLGVTANSTTSSTLSNTTAKLSSNISYSKSFPNTPFSMGINLRHNQDLNTKSLDLSLPDLSFTVNNLYPFKKVKSSLFLQNISTRLTASATNHISNDLGSIGVNGKDSIAPVNSSTIPFLLNRAKKGIKMNVPLTTSVKVMRFFTLTPSLSIDETLYFEKLVWGVSPSGNTFVVKDTIKGFNNITNYSGSIGLTTRIYGYKAFKGKIQAIHHVMNPSIGMTFAPDFADPKYGYFQRFDVVNKDVHTIVYKSVHEGFIYGSSRQGKTSALNFGLGNVLEMKVKGKNDTIARKIPIFNTLSISSSYNFLALKNKLSPFNISANTNVLDNKFNISLAAVIDPYKYVLDTMFTNERKITTIVQHRSETLAWKDGFSLGALTSFNFSLSTNLNPKGQKKDTDTRKTVAQSTAITETEKAYLINNPDRYVDFSIPWNLRINYNFNYSKTGFQPANVTNGVRVSGDVSLSTKWKIVFGSGYDFKSKEITQTQFSLNRDLHCWTMSLSWVPFGYYQSYTFTIAVKASMLRDLKQARHRDFRDAL